MCIRDSIRIDGIMLLLSYLGIPIQFITCLLYTSPDDMFKVRNLGKKSLDEVLLKLKQLNLHLRSSED